MSKRRVAVLMCSAVALTLAAAQDALATTGPYVVVYKDAVADPVATTTQLQTAYGFNARFRYLSALKGFSATLTDTQQAQLAADPSVAYVTTDRTVNAS